MTAGRNQNAKGRLRKAQQKRKREEKAARRATLLKRRKHKRAKFKDRNV